MAKLNITIADGFNIISFQGVSSTDSLSAHRMKLEEIVRDCKNGEKWVLDLSPFKKIDSSSIASLVHINRGLKERGAHFALAGLSSAVVHIFRMSELLDVFKIYKSVEDLV